MGPPIRTRAEGFRLPREMMWSESDRRSIDWLVGDDRERRSGRTALGFAVAGSRTLHAKCQVLVALRVKLKVES
jgi:hypothetical protein